MRGQIRLLLAAGVTAVTLSPAAATHARPSVTCAAFSNQAAAQRAANTRDADGDGVYCESLPCPCLKPGATTKPKPQAKAPRKHRLGPGKRLGPVTQHAACTVDHGLPDRDCTPGVYYAHATKRDICATGYTQRVRSVSESDRDAVYGAYGMELRLNFDNGELDHLVPLELGGTNARANLFPESASPRPGSHEKDRLENRLHDQVCAGEMRLRTAQRLIARDWVAAYRARF